ncbi:MAG: uroporphyrinogen-III C-methyltransferase [Gammaproteobacteria bacterium]
MSEPEQPEETEKRQKSQPVAPPESPPGERRETENPNSHSVEPTKTRTPKPPREPERERPPRGGIILAVVALILALVALAGIGALGWSWYQLRGEQARVSRLEGRLSNASGQIAALGSAKADQQSVNTLASKLHDLQQSENQRLSAMQEALRKVTSRIAGADTAYREDEAAALMRLAQTRLELAADPAGATRALELADQTLAAADDPTLDPVHIALVREITALKAVPRVDIGGTFVKLQALSAKVDSLPLAGSSLASTAAPHSATKSAGFSWRGIGAAFKRAFSPLIVVRHGPKARPLLPPKQAYYVRENVKLALASAELALMQRNAKAWQASLDQARGWVQDWFSDSNPDVKQTIAALNKLAAIKLSPALPTLGAASAKLAALHAPGPATSPAPSPATR